MGKGSGEAEGRKGEGSFENWHAISYEEVMSKLRSREAGLSEAEAYNRLEKYGENKLEEKKKSVILMLLGQLNSFFVYLLIIAAVIAYFMNHLVDFSVIIAVIMINTGIGFFQNYKAERAIAELKKMLVQKTKVIRENKLIEVDAGKVVPGDVLFLEEGDKIVADARLVLGNNLQVNEAILTGESLPVDKDARTLGLDVKLIERKNILYSGTTIVRGNCKAVVFSTGMSTEMGKIASLVQDVKETRPPLLEKIDSFGRKLGIIVLLTSLLVVLIGLALGLEKVNLFLTAISLAVAAVPEGLPAVITICLAFSVSRMRKQNGLVKTLPAAETLGRVTVICADKTGTLTREEMLVTSLFYDNILVDFNKAANMKSKTLDMLMKINCLCSNARIEKLDKGIKYVGDPTEKALLKAAIAYGFDKKQITDENKRMKEITFSSKRKMMSVIRECNGECKGMRNYVKGAPDVIIKKCKYELRYGTEALLSERRRKELFDMYEKMAVSGLRVLGFAYKNIENLNIDEEHAEQDLVFVGWQGLLDPPRPEIKIAIEICKRANISVKMITGDSLLTAMAVAHRISLFGESIEGDKLEKMSDSELSSRVGNIVVFARVTPEQKLRVVNILRGKGEIVAVTGDGVNDAPALKNADIGVAMGVRGSDVARETADIILLDDNFATIVTAVKEGRRAYDNIKKFIKFMLATNFGEMGIVLVGMIARLPLPLLPLQILWINLVSDSLPALSLSAEPADENVMQKTPNHQNNILKGIMPFILISTFFAILVTMVSFLIYLKNIDEARTAALTTVVLFEALIIFTCKSDRRLRMRDIFSNKFLVLSVLAAIVLQFVLVYSPLGSLFGVVPLKALDWLIIVPLSFSGLVIFEVWKFVKEKKKGQEK